MDGDGDGDGGCDVGCDGRCDARDGWMDTMRSYYIVMDCAYCAELELHNLTVGDASISHPFQTRP